MKSDSQQITNNEFEILIQNSESSTLDFKREMYELDNDLNHKKVAKLVKDIISFTNTPRTETSYIIIGIGEKSDGNKDFVGIDKVYDDAILQAKIKNKVFPIPKFSFSTIASNGKRYGIFSFPITKYDMPVYPSIKMPGLTVGMPYYRLGSSNEEAFGNTVLHINDWLKSLPNYVKQKDKNDFNNELASVLKQATNPKNRLTEIFPEVFALAKNHKLPELIKFCNYELKGINQNDLNSETDFFKYRLQNVIFSMGEYKPNPYYTGTFTPAMLIDLLKENDNYYDYKILLPFSLTTIEEFIERSDTDKAFGTFKSSTGAMLPNYNGKDRNTTIYFFNENYTSLYKNIRQKLIDILVAL